jgi:hypothetical protein
VVLVASTRIAQGDVEVDAEPLDVSLVSAAAPGLRPVELEGPRPPRAPIPGTGVIDDELVAGPAAAPSAPGMAGMPTLAAIPVVAEAHAPPPVLPEPGPVPPAAAPQAVASAASAAAALPAPQVPAPARAPVAATSRPEPGPLAVPPPLMPPPLVGPQATIEVCLPDGTTREVAFDGSVLGVGRGTDNDIVIPDERVSRHHGRFSARHGTLVYTDLGSTNGSQVGGVRVHEIALGAGDVVRLGRATLTVRPRP